MDKQQKKKRIFLYALLLIAILTLTTMAQSPGISVTTSPPGAEVILTGDAIVSGVTPAVFRQGLVGRYKVSIIRPGYESYRTTVVLDPSLPYNLNVTLSPKTRYKAAARSLFIPGWGQRYADQGSKGFLFQLGVLGAGLAYLIADSDFQGKYDTYRDRQSEFAAATTYTEQERTYARMAEAKKSAWDAEDTRRVTLGIGAGIWALNFLDALLFFPENRETFSYKGVGLTPAIEHQRVGLALSARF